MGLDLVFGEVVDPNEDNKINVQNMITGLAEALDIPGIMKDFPRGMSDMELCKYVEDGKIANGQSYSVTGNKPPFGFVTSSLIAYDVLENLSADFVMASIGNNKLDSFSNVFRYRYFSGGNYSALLILADDEDGADRYFEMIHIYY